MRQPAALAPSTKAEPLMLWPSLETIGRDSQDKVHLQKLT